MNAQSTDAWARRIVERAADTAAASLRKFCRKPRSPKRLHRARKSLARLLAGLYDVAGVAGTDGRLIARVRDLHRRAGKVRDADVLLKRVKAYRNVAGGAELEELKTVAHKLRKRRKKARRKLQALIDDLPALRQ
ncbi:MAG TPA: CHAD domain-containing protein [Candidatus Rubrimentiphilum sp.]|nr:CHAD domain-containing protein [Candidatus Rubrimentiphilum sp.]